MTPLYEYRFLRMLNSEIYKYFNFPEAKLVTAQLFQKALNSSGGTV